MRFRGLENGDADERPAAIATRYHYLVFRLADIAPLLMPPDSSQPDAYVAEDATSRPLRDCLEKGYRWVRTDGEYAVFEKVTRLTPAATGGSSQS